MPVILFWQLITLILIYTIFIAFALYYGVMLGYSINKRKKPELPKVYPAEFSLPVELQPKSILDLEDDENQFLR